MIYPGDLSGFSDEQLVECLHLLRQETRNFEFEIARREEEAKKDKERAETERENQERSNGMLYMFFVGLFSGGLILTLFRYVCS